MYGQLIELIIFAAIALFIVNKLIATLGSTSEKDLTGGKSFFGEKKGMKDVTSTASRATSMFRTEHKPKPILVNLKNLIVVENENAIKDGLVSVLSKIPTFDIKQFLKGAKMAFQITIESAAKSNKKMLSELIDKRYIDKFDSLSLSYGEYSKTDHSLEAHISELYMFGNTIFIKVLFNGVGVTSNIENLNEEWTFIKSALDSDNKWQLTNVDRPQ